MYIEMRWMYACQQGRLQLGLYFFVDRLFFTFGQYQQPAVLFQDKESRFMTDGSTVTNGRSERKTFGEVQANAYFPGQE